MIGYLILAITLGFFAAFGIYAYLKWKKEQPDFTYRKVDVKYISVKKTEARDAQIKHLLYERVIQGRKFEKEDADAIYAIAYKKPKRTKERDNAIKRAIDEMFRRTGYKVKGDNVKLFIQPFPISHEHPRAKNGFVMSFGVSYPWYEKAYVTIMPESRGGVKSTKSLVIHEIAGHFIKWEEGFVNEDGSKNGDGGHTDKEFWAVIDSKVDL